jgi:hypothetical protein
MKESKWDKMALFQQQQESSSPQQKQHIAAQAPIPNIQQEKSEKAAGQAMSVIGNASNDALFQLHCLRNSRAYCKCQ